MRDKEFWDAEKARFNALSQEDANRIVSECEGRPAALRTCWYCNPAQEHLRDRDYFICMWGCGVSYVRSFPSPILAMRMRGEEVTDETMTEFRKALEGQASEGDACAV